MGNVYYEEIMTISFAEGLCKEPFDERFSKSLSGKGCKTFRSAKWLQYVQVVGKWQLYVAKFRKAI